MIFLFLLFGAIHCNEIIKPQLGYCVHDRYLKSLHSVFEPLSKKEKETGWGKEYQIASFFAKELDLYQAITAFKRAAIMIDDSLIERRREIDYQIINCYYLGGKYKEATEFFDHSLLANIEPSFKAFHDLLIVLYDSFSILKNDDRMKTVEIAMQTYYPNTKSKLEMSANLLQGNIEKIHDYAKNTTFHTEIASLEESLDIAFHDEHNGMMPIDPKVQKNIENKLNSLHHLQNCQEASSEILTQYSKERKSPFLASSLNAIAPGMGYLYLGQKQTALTAFLLNSVTSAAAYYFYTNKNLPAAILTLSFESGWYLGGIYGAHEEASFYNKRCFEKAAHYRMRDNKLYPVLMLTHGF